MKKTRLLVSLVVAIAATAVALRYRTLQRLETKQVQLRQQVEEATGLRTAIAQKQNAPTMPSGAGLSNPEHLELLRLRNEVGQLRRELVTESNQMTIQAAKTGAKPVPASAYDQTEGAEMKAQMRRQLVRSDAWALALHQYALENHHFPTRLADAAIFAPKLKGAENLAPQLEGAEDFEVLVTGKPSAIKVPSCVIALREKQPWKAANGKWGRAYIFADFHSEIAYSATEDFTEWEGQRTQIDSAPAR